jgi:hypothetical protein
VLRCESQDLPLRFRFGYRNTKSTTVRYVVSVPQRSTSTEDFVLPLDSTLDTSTSTFVMIAFARDASDAEQWVSTGSDGNTTTASVTLPADAAGISTVANKSQALLNDAVAVGNVDALFAQVNVRVTWPYLCRL